MRPIRQYKQLVCTWGFSSLVANDIKSVHVMVNKQIDIGFKLGLKISVLEYHAA